MHLADLVDWHTLFAAAWFANRSAAKGTSFAVDDFLYLLLNDGIAFVNRHFRVTNFTRYCRHKANDYETNCKDLTHNQGLQKDKIDRSRGGPLRLGHNQDRGRGEFVAGRYSRVRLGLCPSAFVAPTGQSRVIGHNRARSAVRGDAISEYHCSGGQQRKANRQEHQ